MGDKERCSAVEAFSSLQSEGWHVKREAQDLLWEEAKCSKRMLASLLLNKDLKQVGEPYLPEDIGQADGGSLKGQNVLQLVAADDISQPSQGVGTTSSRCLRLKLTDGKRSCMGVEARLLQLRAEDLAPGTKFVVRGAQLVLGVLLFDTKSLEVLGGRVDALAEAWEFQRKFGTLERPTGGAGAGEEAFAPPPPFRPFIPGQPPEPGAASPSMTHTSASQAPGTAASGSKMPQQPPPPRDAPPSVEAADFSTVPAGSSSAEGTTPRRGAGASRARPGFIPYQPPPHRNAATAREGNEPSGDPQGPPGGSGALSGVLGRSGRGRGAAWDDGRAAGVEGVRGGRGGRGRAGWQAQEMAEAREEPRGLGSRDARPPFGTPSTARHSDPLTTAAAAPHQAGPSAAARHQDGAAALGAHDSHSRESQAQNADRESRGNQWSAPAAVAREKLLNKLAAAEQDSIGGRGRGRGRGRGGRRGRRWDEEAESGMTLDEWEAQQKLAKLPAGSDDLPAADEALARELQRQLDLEDAAAAAPAGGQLPLNGAGPAEDLRASLFSYQARQEEPAGRFGGRGRGRGRRG